MGCELNWVLKLCGRTEKFYEINGIEKNVGIKMEVEVYIVLRFIFVRLETSTSSPVVLRLFSDVASSLSPLPSSV